MVIQDIRYRRCIPPGKRANPADHGVCCRVRIREYVDGPVQENTVPDPIRVILPRPSFDKIADKVAEQQIGIRVGKKTVGNVVHIGGNDGTKIITACKLQKCSLTFAPASAEGTIFKD